MTPRMKEHYETVVRPELLKQFGYANPMQVPRLDKIVVNMGVGEATGDSKVIRLDGRRDDLDHRPEADRHQGEALGRGVQAARGHADRRQSDAPAHPDV